MRGGWLNWVNYSTSGAGSAPVGVVSDDDPVAADLSVTVLLREVQAQVPCAVGIGGSVLPGSGGADDIVAGHEVSFVCPLIIQGHRCPKRKPCASGLTGTGVIYQN